MRKIKLMALLLATLMIVSAFAGCAGVKKEELDALDVRVQALEDLLNGQQKSLEEIKNDLKAGNDNSEVLDAIESIKTDLEDKIKDVNGRIDTEVGKVDTPTASVSDETKAAQQKALALIEVRRAEFNKAAGDYAEDDYVKISEALGTATGAVNAATTVDAVNAAMAALDAELDKYMSYAMKAYDYYTQLLGGITEDAEELVDEAKAFLKTVKAVYDAKEKVEFVGKLNGTSTKEADEYVAELAYLVSEGTKAERDEYINIYAAIEDLCTLYSSKSAEKEIPYVEDGKIKYEKLKSLYEYTAEADKLVEEIEDAIGENLIYGTEAYDEFDELYTKYEEYVEQAVLLGGEALVALVTNSAELIAAEDDYKLIEEAAESFDEATRISAGKYGNVFYYYTELLAAKAQNLLEWEKSAKETVWVADYYAAVEETLESWKGDLSDENVKAIIDAKKSEVDKDGNKKLPSNFTYTQTKSGESYIKDKHHNDLLVAALNQFKDEIAPKIVALNDYDEASIDMVLAYDEVEELFADLVVLQKATTDKGVKYPNNVAIKLDVANLKTIVREADIFDDYTEARLNVALANTNIDTYTKTNGLIDLYTFEADIDQLDDDDKVYFEDKNDDGDVTDTDDADNRKDGDIYKFLTSTYNTIKGLAKAINNEIAKLEDNVELFGLSDNLKFVTLEGKYKELENAEEFKSNGHLFTATSDDLNGSAAGTGIYVALEDIDWNVTDVDDKGTTDTSDDVVTPVTDKVALDRYLTNVAKKTSTVTIEAFIHVYPEFKDMLNLDEFEAAKKAMEDRMVALFDIADQFVDELEAVDYVHNNAVIYKDGYDLSGNYDPDLDNGKVDVSETPDPTDPTKTIVTVLEEHSTTMPTYLVSLEDKANVEVAYKSYTKWAEEGGALSQAIFTTYSDDDNDYADVYYMKGFTDDQYASVKYATNKIVTLKTQLEKLEGVANNFVKTVNNIKDVDAANPFVVNQWSAQNHLSALPTLSADNATKYRSYFAWTNFERRDTEYNRYDGTYTYVKSNGYDIGSVSVSTSAKGDKDENVVGKMTFTTKAQLITAAMNLYNNFYNAHIDYIPDADNVYEPEKKVVAGVETLVYPTVYYQATEYVAHAAFDKAAEEYAKYDLLNVKSYLYDVLDRDASDVQKKLEDSIIAADSMTKIENLLISRIGEQGIDVKAILGGNADAIQARSALYDFDRLAEALK